MSWKLILKISLTMTIVVFVGVGMALYPRLSNMKSEYETAQAINALKSHLRENGGKWPTSAADLGDKYPEGGIVVIDYSADSSVLVRDPGRLRRAVRPRSGKFLTYPAYESDLEELLLVLQESQSRDREEDGG